MVCFSSMLLVDSCKYVIILMRLHASFLVGRFLNLAVSGDTSFFFFPLEKMYGGRYLVIKGAIKRNLYCFLRFFYLPMGRSYLIKFSLCGDPDDEVCIWKL